MNKTIKAMECYYRIQVDFEYLQSFNFDLNREYCRQKSKALFITPILIRKVEIMLRQAGVFFSVEKVWYRNNNVLTLDKFFN